MKTFRYVQAGYTLPKLRRVDSVKGRYYFDPAGNRYASVTTFLKEDPKKKEGLAKWRARVGEDNAKEITKQAGINGTLLHSVMESYLQNKFATHDDVMAAAKNMAWQVDHILLCLNRVDNIRHQEVSLFSRVLGLAGTTDCIAEFDGVKSIIDFKTSLKRKREEWITNYFLQECCYSLMMEEMTGIQVPQLVTIIISNDGYCDVFIKQRKDYFKLLKERILDFRKLTYGQDEKHQVPVEGMEPDSSNA